LQHEAATGALTGPVAVTGGQVADVPGPDPSVMAFKGIPFAAPVTVHSTIPGPNFPPQGLQIGILLVLDSVGEKQFELRNSSR
jgi:hypothetical protein